MNSRHGATTADELALLLRQHEVVGTSQEQLDKLLGEEVNRAQALNVELRPPLRAMRHIPSQLMMRCDEAITRAHTAHARRSYGEGLRQLKEAQRWLSCLRGLAEDASELKAAVSEYEGLLALLRSDYLLRLPTINSVARLIFEADGLLAAGAQADNLLGAGRGRQARFIAALCREKLRELGTPAGSGRTETQRLEAIIRAQSIYCERTSSFAPSPHADGMMRQAFARLSDLLNEGRVTLVVRLTGDIEDELASRRAVLDAVSRACSTAPRSRSGADISVELKRIISEESWGKAATHLLQETLFLLTEEAGAVRVAARHAAEGLDALRRASELVTTESGANNS